MVLPDIIGVYISDLMDVTEKKWSRAPLVETKMEK